MQIKKFLLAFVSIWATEEAVAQNANSGAVQKANLNLSEVVGVSLPDDGGGNGSGGSAVEMPISSMNGLSEGIESPALKIKLQSTTPFDISISASSNTFIYSGSSSFGTTMNVADVLAVMITQNATGGSVAGGFGQYKSVTGTIKQPIITSGQPGERSFEFKYKAIPGFEYPAGTYTTDIIYTITKR